MKKLLIVLFAVISILTMSSCKKAPKVIEKVGVGYGITHGNNVGYAKVTIKNDVVKDVTFEEAFLPSDWAKVKTTNGLAPDDVIEYQSGTTTIWAAKYIVIGNKQFTGTLREVLPFTYNGKTLTSQAIKYTATDVPDLYVWLAESEANAKWYFENSSADKAYIATNEWQKHTYESAGRSGRTKTEANYWPGDNNQLGWKGNMDEIAAALKGTKMDQANKISKPEGSKYWVIDNVTTGATLTDFKDYYEIARRAYNNAK